MYEDGCYCFVCEFKCDISEVLNEKEVRAFRKVKQEPDNIYQKFEYIRTLPEDLIRGLRLHHDNLGYFVLWPSGDFYKQRLYRSDGPRYVGPKGFRPPLFEIKGKKKDIVIVIEGELNCLSLSLALGDCGISIVSPGTASDLTRYIDYYLLYKQVYIIVDRDPAGVVNGLELKNHLLSKNKSVRLFAVDKDFNDILQSDGPEILKHHFMEMIR